MSSLPTLETEGDTFTACFDLDATPTESDFVATITNNTPGIVKIRTTSIVGYL